MSMVKSVSITSAIRSLLILNAKLLDPNNIIQTLSFLSDKNVPEPEFKQVLMEHFFTVYPTLKYKAKNLSEMVFQIKYKNIMALQEVLSSTKVTHGNNRYSTFIKYAA